MMRLKDHSFQDSTTLQQYIRVDDEIEILVDDPLSIEMDGAQISDVSAAAPLLPGNKKEEDNKCKTTYVEYGDSCLQNNIKTPQAFHTPAQHVPKKHGNKSKNCTLLNSVVEKRTTDLTDSTNLNKSVVGNVICGKKDSICDKTPCLLNLAPKKNCGVKNMSLKTKTRFSSSNKKCNEKLRNHCSSKTTENVSNSTKISLRPKCSKTGSLKGSVGKTKAVLIESVSEDTFYDKSSDIVFVGDTLSTRFNSSLECHDSSSSIKPDVVYLKTKPSLKTSKSDETSNNVKLKTVPNKASQNNRAQKDKSASSSGSSVPQNINKKKNFAQREMTALYENLKEISWAHDKKFTTLLKSNDSSRHSGRLSALKLGVENSCVKPKQRCKVSYEKNKVQGTKNAPKKTAITKSRSPNSLSTFVKNKLKKSAKIALSKKTCPPYKQKIAMAKTRSLQRNMKKSAISSKNQNTRVKSLSLSAAKPFAKKRKLSEELTVQVREDSDTSHLLSRKGDAKPTDILLSSGTPLELGLLGNIFQNSANNLISALQRHQELRVTLEPLENTNLWASNCNILEKVPEVVESYTRRTLQQRMLRESKSSAGSNGKNSRSKRKHEEESLRSSVRQSECAFRYKEIVVRKHDNYIQIVLVPNIQKQNCLTIEAMKELKEAFLSARKDANCKAVLLNSSGTFFCSGIDLGQLHGSNKKHIAEEMATTIRDLILTLAIFPKPVIAVVNGYAIGLGVTLLTFCDVVLSSDKATFCIPSTRLGYIPEGGALLTLPQVVGSTVAIEMLLQCRRLTAEQALKYGLVSEIIWPSRLMEEAIPRVDSIVNQPLHVMEATKTMVRYHLWEKLAVQLNQEWRLLPSQWLSSICQQKIKQQVLTGWLQD